MKTTDQYERDFLYHAECINLYFDEWGLTNDNIKPHLNYILRMGEKALPYILIQLLRHPGIYKGVLEKGLDEGYFLLETDLQEWLQARAVNISQLSEAVYDSKILHNYLKKRAYYDSWDHAIYYPSLCEDLQKRAIAGNIGSQDWHSKYPHILELNNRIEKDLEAKPFSNHPFLYLKRSWDRFWYWQVRMRYRYFINTLHGIKHGQPSKKKKRK